MYFYPIQQKEIISRAKIAALRITGDTNNPSYCYLFIINLKNFVEKRGETHIPAYNWSL